MFYGTPIRYVRMSLKRLTTLPITSKESFGNSIDRSSVTLQLLERIKTALIRGELLPGDYLPFEAELTQTLGIGKSSVREAIKMLQAIGIVEVKRGQGTMICLEPGVTLVDSIKRVMNGQPHLDFRNRYLHKNGSVVHVLWSARWSDEEQVRIGVARDVTAQVQAEDDLRFLAHHDPLTKLTNRSLFYGRLEAALSTAKRYQNRFALLFLDVNDFKRINDVHGHAVGDAVLCEVARRLSGCVRETDTVARMGGDEFTVILTDVHSKEAAIEKAAQILEVLSEPLAAEVGGADMRDIGMPSCSVGVATYPEDGKDADTLLNYADVKMYRMKRRRSR